MGEVLSYPVIPCGPDQAPWACSAGQMEAFSSREHSWSISLFLIEQEIPWDKPNTVCANLLGCPQGVSGQG